MKNITIFLFFLLFNIFYSNAQPTLSKKELTDSKASERFKTTHGYIEITKLHKNYLVQTKNGKYLLVDARNNTVTDTSFQVLTLAVNPNFIFLVKKEELAKSYLVDEDGAKISEAAYDYFNSFEIGYIQAIRQSKMDVFFKAKHLFTLDTAIDGHWGLYAPFGKKLFYSKHFDPTTNIGQVFLVDSLGTQTFLGDGDLRIFDNYFVIQNQNTETLFNAEAQPISVVSGLAIYSITTKIPNSFVYKEEGRYGLMGLDKKVIVAPHDGVQFMKIGAASFWIFKDNMERIQTVVNAESKIISNNFSGAIKSSTLTKNFAIVAYVIEEGGPYNLKAYSGIIDTNFKSIVGPIFSYIEQIDDVVRFHFDNTYKDFPANQVLKNIDKINNLPKMEKAVHGN